MSVEGVLCDNKIEKYHRVRMLATKKISFSFFLSYKLCRCCLSRKGKALAANYDEKVSKYRHDMAIESYIKKMNEVDYLKHVLLDPDQLKVLDFLSKPVFSMEDHILPNEDAIDIDIPGVLKAISRISEQDVKTEEDIKLLLQAREHLYCLFEGFVNNGSN